MTKTLIRSATVVFPDHLSKTNILIGNGKILAVDAPPTATADEVIDASGMILMPGVVDDQVHFREPGLTEKEDLLHASRACAAGGVTTFLEMPNTRPPAITRARVEEKEQLAAKSSRVNYGFYIGATTENVAELQQASNIPGIKIFIGSSTGDLLVDEQEALERIFSQTSLPICAHCEDEATIRRNLATFAGTTDVADHSRIRSAEAAWVSTRRAIAIATHFEHRFHVLHVSTAAELELIDGQQPWITAEVCPHHLFFSVDDYSRLGTLIQMNPSVKTRDDNRGLWEGLLQGRIQVIATDHAPHTWEEKQRPYPQSPSGLPAIENSLALILNQVYQGKCTLNQVASWMCDAPARVWGIVGKGRIAVGYDADLVLVDMEQAKTIRSSEQYTKCRWSPWDGVTLHGWPQRTWVGGQLVFDRGRIDESVRGRKPRFDHTRGGFWKTADGIGTD